MSETGNIVEKIEKLKREKKAIILAHNYQRPEIQDIADYVDDSVGLAKRAMEEKDAEIIIHCSVDFMAETAVLLNPDKKVFLPSLGSKCPMAAMLPASQVKAARKQYPNLPIVLYVNTSAEAKAYSDVCCTSANASKIVASLESDEVIFGPDANLAWYIQKETGKKIITIPETGFCLTHILFLKEDILLLKDEHPNAKVMAHPECTPDVQEIADFVGSTTGMCKYVQSSPNKEFIVGTEVGLIHRLKKENPDKIFIPAYKDAFCVNMKRNDLRKVYLTLKEERNRVLVPNSVMKKARESLEKMFEIAQNLNQD
ncbi:MAG: quinolinate synthase NadA [Candidatus Bathyarchaeota archaeon]